MTWGRLDDTFDGHRKRRVVSLAADGLLVRAIAHAAKHETDGFVDAPWVEQQGKPGERRRALREALTVKLLEELAAGTTREVVAPRKKGVRDAEHVVTIGPFDVDGYVVHDFLDYNPSNNDLQGRRQRERQKKSPKDSPGEARGESLRDSGQGREGKGVGGSEVDADARRDIATADRVVAVFESLGVLIERDSALNAVARFPSAGHEQAARGCVEYLRVHPSKDPGLTFHRFLEQDARRQGGNLRAVPDRPKKRFDEERSDFSHYDDLVNQ